MVMAVVWPNDLRPPGRWAPHEIADQVGESLSQVCLHVIRDSSLYTEGWDTLSQPRFWRTAMHLHPDRMLVNLAHSRQILDTLSTLGWQLRSDKYKKAYQDSLRQAHRLTKGDEIYFTTGRSHFYRYESMLPHIDMALSVFAEEGVDPWFAQAILLIESPGKLQFSSDGAYGAFQLMKGVAREMGLIVNDTLDQRADFESSARGAARLIQKVCLPQTRRMLEEAGVAYEENETWFKLLVLHVYHAGARNVDRVLRKIKTNEGGMEFIQELWQVKSRRFGNASQNYSQIILAAFMEMDELLESIGILCPPDMLPNPRHGKISPKALQSIEEKPTVGEMVSE